MHRSPPLRARWHRSVRRRPADASASAVGGGGDGLLARWLCLAGHRPADVPSLVGGDGGSGGVWRIRPFDLKAKAASLGVRLTDKEVDLLRRRAGRLLRRGRGGGGVGGTGPSGSATSGRLTQEEFHLSQRRLLQWARKQEEVHTTREAMLATIEQPDQASSWGKRLLETIGYVGAVSWSMAGTQVAGETGMNLIGCSLVGCISAMGGGTVNNILFGDIKGGVGWVRNPHSTLMIALATSVITFFTWPVTVHWLAERRLQRIHDVAESNSWLEWCRRTLRLVDSSCITKDQFLAACKHEDFYNDIYWLLYRRLPASTEPTAQLLFDLIDEDADDILSIRDLENLVKFQYVGSTPKYMLDTISVAASSVTGTASAIARGLNPIVCVASSVTLCFGGVMRDIICKREVALGSQSFAFCTATGAAVYVAGRELRLRGLPLPLGVRILLAAGTTVALRLVAFFHEAPFLTPMYSCDEAICRYSERALAQNAAVVGSTRAG